MDCLFSVLTMSFQEKFFILRKSNLSIWLFSFMDCLAHLRILCLTQGKQIVSWFLLEVLEFLGFIVMSMMHLSWFLYKMWYNGLNCLVYFTEYRYPIVPASLTEKTIFLPLNCLCTFFENQLSISLVIFLDSPHLGLFTVSLYTSTTLFWLL